MRREQDAVLINPVKMIVVVSLQAQVRQNPTCQVAVCHVCGVYVCLLKIAFAHVCALERGAAEVCAAQVGPHKLSTCGHVTKHENEEARESACVR